MRPAAPGDIAFALAVFPWIMEARVPLSCIFISHIDSLIVGAAAFSVIPYAGKWPGFRSDIFVLPRHRGHGYGTALLATLSKAAGAWDARWLHTWSSYPLLAKPPFLAKHCFRRVREISYFEIPRFESPMFDDWLSRFQRRGRIPSSATVVPLSSIDARSIATLYAEFFGIPNMAAVQLIEKAMNLPVARAASQVLMIDQVPSGLIIFKLDEENIPTVDLLIVDPRLRMGWPAILLLQAAAKEFLRGGYVHVRFHANEEAPVTKHIAKLLGANARKQEFTFAIEIDEHPSE